MIICEICKQKFNDLNVLSRHITHKHQIKPKEYYDEYRRKENEGICPTCNKETKFITFKIGYNKFCDQYCKKGKPSKNIFCKICNRIFPNELGFSMHLSRTHKIKPKEYYDKYFRKENEGICEICGSKNIKFEGIKAGYPRRTCSIKCSKELDSYKEKLKNTNLKKYGVENVFQSEKIKEKIKQTNLKRYGVENPSQIDELKHSRVEKAKNTCLEKYGVEYAWNRKKVQEKLQKERIKKLFSRINKFKKIKPLFSIDKFSGILTEYKWYCYDCKNEFKSNLISGKIPICSNCYPTKGGTSLIEKEIQDWLSNYIKINKNKRFSFDEKIYELDVHIPSHDIGIELDGLYWHSEIQGTDKNYHLNKTNWFKENFNIQVIHIFENEWLYKQDIVKSIILNKLNLTKNRIYARKCKIEEISSKQYKDFLEDNHIQGPINSKYRFGLFYNNELVSVIGFGKSRFKKNETELHRFCCKINTSIVGGFSRLLKNFIRKYDIDDIVSYCDRRYSDASSYIKNNFIIKHISSPNYFYFHSTDYILRSRIQFQKHKLKQQLKIFDSNITEWENMQMNGWNRIWDCGNFVLKYKRE